MLEIWAWNVPVREHQSSAGRACDVLVREHQASESQCESGPTVSRVVSLSLFGEKSQEASLTAPEGAGGSTLLPFEERCDSSVDLREWRPADRTGGRVVTTGPSRSVGSLTCSTGSDAAGCTWVSVREDGAGPADPVGVFKSGSWVGGNIGFTRECSLPLGLLEKGDEVFNLHDPSLMGKRIERPLLSIGEHRIEPCQRSRCFRVGLPTLQTDRHIMAGKKCFKVGIPTTQSDRHHLVRERKG